MNLENIKEFNVLSFIEMDIPESNFQRYKLINDLRGKEVLIENKYPKNYYLRGIVGDFINKSNTDYDIITSYGKMKFSVGNLTSIFVLE